MYWLTPVFANTLEAVTLYSYANCMCNGSDFAYMTKSLGQVSSNKYDLAGRLTLSGTPGGPVVNYAYDRLGRLTNITDFAGGSTTNWFNAQNRMTVSSNQFGQLVYTNYDILDRPITMADANGVSVDQAFDTLNRVLTCTNTATGWGESFGYRTNFPGPVLHTNGLGKVTKYEYDAYTRQITETNANLEVTRYEYDGAGSLTKLTDGKSHDTRWKYDQFGRMTNKTDHASNRMFDYVYNANGWTTSRTDGKNRQTQYGYNAMGSVTNVVYPGSSNVYAYNSMQQLTNMVDLTGTNRFTYENGFLIEEDGPWASDAVHLGYMHGVRTNLTLSRPSGGDWTQTYTYDPTLRLNTLVSGAGAFTYSFRGPGNLITNLALPNGATITNSYDSAARWTGTYLKNSAGTILNYHAYVYNAGNQRTKQTRIDGSYVDYGYDSIGQVVSGIGKETNGTARLNERYLYAYDAAGNLNYRTNNDLTQTFTVDNLNQLSTVARNSTMTVAGIAGSTATNVTIADNGNSPVTAILYSDKSFARTNVTILSGSNVFTAVGADSLGRSDTNSVTLNLPTSVSYTYDANGNLTADGKRTLVYDDENQLTMVTVTNGTGSSTCSVFVYDGKNRRRVRLESNWVSSAWVKTAEVRYVYDGNLVIQERDSNNSPTVTHTRGTDLSGTLEAGGGIGGLLGRTDHSGGAPAHAYYHADGNGNVTVLVNASQIIVAKYVYDSFGNTLAKIGPLAEANLYRFSSKEAHSVSGLIYYLYRYYDPNLQRWLTRDPIGEKGARNLFLFVGNYPVGRIDPNGLFWEELSQVLTATAAGAAAGAGVGALTGLIAGVPGAANGAIVGAGSGAVNGFLAGITGIAYSQSWGTILKNAAVTGGLSGLPAGLSNAGLVGGAVGGAAAGAGNAWYNGAQSAEAYTLSAIIGAIFGASSGVAEAQENVLFDIALTAAAEAGGAFATGIIALLE